MFGLAVCDSVGCQLTHWLLTELEVLFGNDSLNMRQVHTIVFGSLGDSNKATEGEGTLYYSVNRAKRHNQSEEAAQRQQQPGYS